MAKNLEILHEAFDASLKKEAIVFSLVSFAVTIITVAILAACVGALALAGLFVVGIAKIGMLAKLVYMMSAAIWVIAMLFAVSALNIFLFTGFSQITSFGQYNLNKIIEAIKARIVQTVITTLLVFLVVLLLVSIVAFPLIFFLKIIGAILAAILIVPVLFLATPILLMVMPAAIFGTQGPIKSIKLAITLGAKNYVFLIKASLLNIAVGVIFAVISLVPLLNLLAGIISLGFFRIWNTALYEEALKRSEQTNHD